MPRRGENIYKRGDGRWEGRYIRGRTPEGRAQYGYVYAATYSACREKRRQRLRELPREITPSNNMTLPEAVELFFAERERKLKESTVSRYRYVVRQYIQPQLGAAPLYTLTEQRVADFYRKLQEQGLSAKSTRDVGVLLRAILRMAAKRGCFCTGLNAELPAYRKRQVEIFTEPEILRLAHHIVNEPDLTGLGVLLTLNSGLRLGELCALRWSDIDLHAGFVRVEREVQRIYEKGCTRLIVQPPKSESSLRRIPLPTDILSLLAAHRPENAGSFCLLTSSGDPLEPRTMQNRYRSLLKRAGVPYRNFHALRHPYVKHTTKIFSLRLMDFQAQAYPDARRKTRGACQLLRVGQSRSPVRPLYNRKRFSCLPPQSKMSWILYAISMRLSGYTSTRSISISASSVVSASASKIALDASFRLSCRACSSCFCFACANTAA